jgi:hypothetical protein
VTAASFHPLVVPPNGVREQAGTRKSRDSGETREQRNSLGAVDPTAEAGVEPGAPAQGSGVAPLPDTPGAPTLDDGGNVPRAAGATGGTWVPWPARLEARAAGDDFSLAIKSIDSEIDDVFKK